LPSLAINNATIHYTDRGQGSNLVLLHGFPLDQRIWRHQSDDLSSDFRVIAPDLPGFGKSTSGGAFSMASLADDVHSLLKKIGALPCILGGLSMGGYVALAFAAKYAADLRGLILTDCRSNADTPEQRAGRDRMIQTAREKGSAAIADEMLPKLMAANASPELVQEIRQMCEACPAETIQRALAGMRDRPELTRALSLLSIPGLIIVGEQDVLAPVELAQVMQKALAGSKLKIIPDCGHLTLVEKPAETTSAIRGFLRYA
jgi:pimeloyl-ACP methyl ester carboxylesterase